MEIMIDDYYELEFLVSFFSCFGFQYCFWRQCIFTTQKEHGKVSGLSSYSAIKTKKEN